MKAALPAGEARPASRPRPSYYTVTLEQRRLDWKLKDLDAWTVEPGAQIALVCAWNAYPLQLLGDRLLEADYQARQTLAIQADIDAAASQGDVAPSGAHYYCCPWAPIYEVRRPVTIAGRKLRPIQQFTIDVSAEEMAEGGPFKSEVIVAQFHPTDRVDYCIPAAITTTEALTRTGARGNGASEARTVARSYDESSKM